MGPRGRSAHRRSCSGAFAGDEAPAQRWAFEIDTMGAMNDPVENGVGQGGIANHLMPAIDRELAGDQQGSPVVAIVDDLKQIAALLGIERFRPQSSMINRRVRSSAFISRGSRPSPRAWARSVNCKSAPKRDPAPI